jgi:flagellar biosynthesis protein FlhA
LSGIRTTDPAFGLEAYWIEPAAREHAQQLGFTVVDPSTVVATHLSEILKRNAHKLLGHEEVQALLDRLAERAPKLVENLTPNALPLGTVVKVIRELLAEGVPVRNTRTIAESLTEQAGRTNDFAELTAAVREALGGEIVQGVFGLSDELPVITLEPGLEQLLNESVDRAKGGTPAFEPGLMDKIQEALVQIAKHQDTAGHSFALLVSTRLRPWLARLTRFSIPNLRVLAYGEIPQDRALRVVATVGDR